MAGRDDAIYSRQSVDRVDSISVESQIDICMKEVQGTPRIYTDKGYSGKNIDRPQFQALLEDIKRGQIGRVIVYRLDRISRSVLDFSGLIQMFQEYNVEFVSTMEKFDTGSPIGKAMLMIIMVFAQLERETIQQRVVDAYRSRSKKGFYMGSRVPYGYRLSETTVGGTRTKMYVEDPDEIENVRAMYQLYSNPQVSLGDVLTYLNERSVKNRQGKGFSRASIRDILLSPVYVKCDMSIYNFFSTQGVEIVNSEDDYVGIHGGYLYTGDKGHKNRSTQIAGQILVLAPHEGAIGSDLWLRCRRKCMNNKAVAKPVKAKATWLARKIKCGYCGYALTAKTLHCKTKEDLRYLFCTRKYSAKDCTKFTSLRADKVEAAVFQELTKKLSTLRAAKVARQQDTEDLMARKQAEINAIDEEISTLLGKISMANQTVMEYINNRITELESQKKNISDEIASIIADGDNSELSEISNYLDKWDSLSVPDKITVVDCVIESIYATPEKLIIKWKI